VNRNNDNSEDDDDDDEDDEDDDERDPSSNPTTMSPNTFLTCPICSSTYHRLGHFLRHAKRKHHIDLSNYHGPHTFDMLTAQIHQMETANMEINKNSIEQINPIKTEEITASKKSTPPSSNLKLNSLFLQWKKKLILFSFQMKPIQHYQLQKLMQQPIVHIVIIKQLILNNLNYIL